MAEHNIIRKVAIVGASGNLGTHITASLLATNKHTITAITRKDSQATFPPKVPVRRVDYSKLSTIVQALQGQDALVITLSGNSRIEETEAKLVRAAAEAGVKWIFPNEWSPDTANEGLVKDLNFLFQAKVNTRKLIESLGATSYAAMVTGFWYEWSLAKAGNFGFDFANRKAMFFDDGEAQISTSTWSHIARAVAALLSLPIAAKEAGQPCLEDFQNQVVYTNSFTVSQKDMLASACRVTGVPESDWTIEKVGAKQRVEEGQKQVKEGDYSGLGKVLYTRVFYPGDGDFEHSKGTINAALGLRKENLDEATCIAIERQAAGDAGR